MRKDFQILALTLGIGIPPLVAQAAVEVVINRGIEALRPIAVLPITGDAVMLGKEAEGLSKTIMQDLHYSGYFSPLPLDVFPERPKAVSDFHAALWKKLQVEAVLFSQLKADTSGKAIFTFQLISTAKSGEKLLNQGSYRVDKKWLRYAAHTISDEVILSLTGEAGFSRTRIAYVEYKPDEAYPFRLHLSDYDGQNDQIMFRSTEPIMSPSWSPDQQTLAYVSFENKKAELVEQTLASQVRTILTSFPGHNGAPSYSPDGKKIALVLSKSGRCKLYLFNRSDKELSPLTAGLGNDTEPCWSADGKTVFFTSDRSGSPQIYKLELGSGYTSRVTFTGLSNQGPKLSADGETLFMVHTPSKGSPQCIAEYRFSSERLRILDGTDYASSFTLSPNGQALIFASLNPSKENVLQLKRTGGHKPLVIQSMAGILKCPAWSYNF